MSKLEYIDALKRAMTGLAPEIMAKTMAYYEQRFVDGMAAGRTEAEIATELGDPKKIAMTLRASTFLSAFEQKKNPANLIRLLVSVLGLAIFNLFMLVPAMVYSALLACMYAAALAFYVAGIAITASGLSGANELVLDGPLRHFAIDDDARRGDNNTQTKVSIGENGINIFQESNDDQASVTRTEKTVTVRENTVTGPTPPAPPAAPLPPAPLVPSSSKVIQEVEAVAGHGVHISTDLDSESRTTQSFFGIGMILAGIMLFLMSLVVSKYTLIGIKRYVEMNFSLLRGH